MAEKIIFKYHYNKFVLNYNSNQRFSFFRYPAKHLVDVTLKTSGSNLIKLKEHFYEKLDWKATIS